MELTQGTNVEILIDVVRIEGFEPRNASTFKVAMEGALARLLAESGVPAALVAGGSRSTVTLDGLRWDGRGGDDGLAAALAQELYRGFER